MAVVNEEEILPFALAESHIERSRHGLKGMKIKIAIAGIASLTLLSLGLLIGDSPNSMPSFMSLNSMINYFKAQTYHAPHNSVNLERHGGNNIQGMEDMHAHCHGDDPLAKIQFKRQVREEHCYWFFGHHCQYNVCILMINYITSEVLPCSSTKTK